MCVSRDFDAQLEAYLLTDSKRRDQVETKVNLGPVYTSRPKVIPHDEHLKKAGHKRGSGKNPGRWGGGDL